MNAVFDSVLTPLHISSLLYTYIPSPPFTHLFPPFTHRTVNRNGSDINFGRNENTGRRGNLGLHMIVTSFDGHIYVIEGRMGCAERFTFLSNRILTLR